MWHSATGTDVEIQIRVMKIQHVSIADGSLSLKVWMRMQWTDPNLAWNPAEFGGLTYTHFNGGAAPLVETSEIWLPDIQLYNAELSSQDTLDPTTVKVESDVSAPVSLDSRDLWGRPSPATL